MMSEWKPSSELSRFNDAATQLANLQRGLTMLISTHDLAFASSVCHDLVLLRAGRVIASGAVDAVLTADTVRALYDVEADVHRDSASGRVMVMPRRHIRP